MLNRDRPATPTSLRPRRLPQLVLGVVTVALGVLASGCITGERPTLISTPDVSDPAVAEVLMRLDRAGDRPFEASYTITSTAAGSSPVEASVRWSDGGDLDVVIGAVTYRSHGGDTETCQDGACATGLDDARVSDLNLTHRFWGDAFATRLRLDDARKVAPATERIETIADRAATCADLPMVGGTTTYCALDAGVLARYSGADVSIQLTSFTDTGEAGATAATTVADA